MIALEKIEPVHGSERLAQLAHMAHDIWFEYWPQFIGEAQTRYMVDKFQSLEAIERDMNEHDYEYYFVVNDKGKKVGYVGVVREYFADAPDDVRAHAHGEAITPLYPNRLFISKIYLLKEERGKHYASQIIAWLVDYAKENDLQGLYLTVNKGNELGIRAYIGNGFEIIESVEADIGEGFVMDDHIMARSV